MEHHDVAVAADAVSERRKRSRPHSDEQVTPHGRPGDMIRHVVDVAHRRLGGRKAERTVEEPDGLEVRRADALLERSLHVALRREDVDEDGLAVAVRRLCEEVVQRHHVERHARRVEARQ